MLHSPRRRAPSERRRIERQSEMTVIVRTIIRGLLPVLVIFGLYIVSYGHLTPGGGFQGGIIVVGALMSFYLAYGYNIVRQFDEEDLGLIGIYAGGTFLYNALKGGAPGSLFSGGIIFILNLIVGLKVAAGTLLVLLILLESLQKGD
jgi:multicomponent Na+:H+ antiporter subunit B